MLKKLVLTIASFTIVIAPLMAVKVSASVQPNLITNPSVETVDPSNSSAPQNWLQGKWGTNTTTFSYPTTGHSGTRGVKVQMTAYTSGDAKWYFAPVAVSPNTQYTFSDYYESSIASDLVAQFDNGSGSYTYVNLGTQAASNSAYTQSNINFTSPTTAKHVTIFHLINNIGWLQTDDYSLSAYSAPSAPTVAITSPAAGSTLSGSVQLSASASDGAGISGVQFKIDGVNVGTEVTTAPYQTTWDTVSATNATHTITAVARNTSNVTATAANVSVTVNNPTTAPIVQISSPVNGATVTGTQTVNANATDAQGVSNVQFKLDGANLGTADTTAPYSVNWDSTTATNGSHNLTAVATNTSSLTTTSSAVAITVNNLVPAGGNIIANPSMETADLNNPQLPQNWLQGKWGTNTTTFSYPTTGHSGTRGVKVQMTAYTSGDAKWYFAPVAVSPNTQYTFSDYYESSIASDLVAQFDDGNGNYTYQYLASESASSSSWALASTSFTTPSSAKNITIFHLISSVGWLQIDDVSLVTSTAPSVSITTPATNTTVSGSVQLTASASAATGVASVQFQVDSVNQGAAVTTAPYQTTWDTSKVTNGSHNLTAVVTSKDNKVATSTVVTVNVSNQAPADGNIIANPSMETADLNNPQLPQNWLQEKWGTNTTAFTYVNNRGHTGTHSAKVQMTKYTSGDAKWYFMPQAVSSDTQYTFSDYYQSDIASEIDVAFTMPNGSTVYELIGNPDPSAQWTQFKTSFSVPLGAVNATVFHLIHGVGSLTIDDASMQKYTPVGFSRPVVTITFDDSIASQYTNGLPLLQKYGFNATFYITSGYVGQPNYMTVDMVKGLQSAGEEISSHTVTHPDLTGLSSSQLTSELSQSQAQLQQWLGVPVNDFASPYGKYNSTVLSAIKTSYRSHRGVEGGFNSKDNFDIYDIKVQNMLSTTTLAQVQSWVNQAKATNTWLVLVYHQVDANPASDLTYNTNPSDLDAQLAYIKSTDVTVETLSQALNEILPQLDQ